MYQNWALTQSTRTAKAGSVQLSQHIAAHFPASMEPAKSYIPIYVDLFLHATIYKVGTTKNSMVKKKKKTGSQSLRSWWTYFCVLSLHFRYYLMLHKCFHITIYIYQEPCQCLLPDLACFPILSTLQKEKSNLKTPNIVLSEPTTCLCFVTKLQDIP